MQKHTIHHGLGHDLARRATRRALEAYREELAEYRPEGDWVDEDRAEVRFTVLERTLSGAVTVGPDSVELELEVPLLWRPFRGLALRVIEGEIRKWIERAREGGLDGSQ